jgi:DHA1 family bicyclomycin/chloramphenicol resistance-like MFS transporter
MGAPMSRAAPPTALVVTVLSLLLGLQPVTTDLYLPGLPALAAHFSAPMSVAQFTLSGLILAFGLAQLAMGPLSDRFGRRPVLLGGLTVYVAGSLAAALAPHIAWLVLGRVLQGVGLAASVVCGRAMVRDLYDPMRGTLMMSRGQSGLGLAALASPAVGGVLASTLGWRATLLATGIFAAAALALIAWRLPETLAQRNPRAIAPAAMAAAWRRIAAHPTFVAWTLLLTFTYGGLYTFLAASSFIYIEVLGQSRLAYGAWLASASSSYLLGTFACRRWVAQHGVARTVARAGTCTLVAGLATAALSLSGVVSPWAIALPQALYSFAHGVHQPCGQAGVVGPFPSNAGAASALSGFVLAVSAFGIGTWLGRSMDGTVLPLTLTQAILAVGTAAVAWTLVGRHGEPSREP